MSPRVHRAKIGQKGSICQTVWSSQFFSKQMDGIHGLPAALLVISFGFRIIPRNQQITLQAAFGTQARLYFFHQTRPDSHSTKRSCNCQMIDESTTTIEATHHGTNDVAL